MNEFQDQWNALIAPHRLIWITEDYPALADEWTELQLIRTKTFPEGNETRYHMVFTKPEGGRYELILTQHAVSSHKTIVFKRGEWELFSFSVNRRADFWKHPYQKKEVDYVNRYVLSPHFEDLVNMAIKKELQQEEETMETIQRFIHEQIQERMENE